MISPRYNIFSCTSTRRDATFWSVLLHFHTHLILHHSIPPMSSLGQNLPLYHGFSGTTRQSDNMKKTWTRCRLNLSSSHDPNIYIIYEIPKREAFSTFWSQTRRGCKNHVFAERIHDFPMTPIGVSHWPGDFDQGKGAQVASPGAPWRLIIGCTICMRSDARWT